VNYYKLSHFYNKPFLLGYVLYITTSYKIIRNEKLYLALYLSKKKNIYLNFKFYLFIYFGLKLFANGYLNQKKEEFLIFKLEIGL
jgi:hypothetical protein